MYKCDKCQDEFKSPGGLKNHQKCCDGIKKYRKGKVINHICPKCNKYIKTSIDKHIKCCDGTGPRRLTHPKKFTKEQFSELSKKRWLDPIYRNKVIDTLKKTSTKTKSKEIEEERRKKLSEHAKKNNYGGYIKGSGRGKSGWYKNYWCDSSWELAFVIYNLEHNIEFKRNNEKFEYLWKDEKHMWIPDFIIDEIYYEIKGYWTEQCQSKFDSFKKPLKILYQKEMKDIINYVTIKYGKDYIKLYENNKEKSCSLCGGYIWKYNNLGVCVNCIKKNNSYAFNNDKKI